MILKQCDFILQHRLENFHQISILGVKTGGILRLGNVSCQYFGGIHDQSNLSVTFGGYIGSGPFQGVAPVGQNHDFQSLINFGGETGLDLRQKMIWH